MKTATITFQAADNYGAFLQAYALQRCISDKLKADNDILNFVSEQMKEHYNVFKKPTSPKEILRNIILTPVAGKLKTRKNMFERDRKELLKMTPEFNTKSEYDNIIKEYDVCVAGSDQIWNLDSEDYTELFFLPNAKKKISYAASAGKHILPEWKETYLDKLSSFDKVSVREKNAAAFFDKLNLPCGKTEICIDPTFLIDRNQYLKIAGQKRLISKKYIIYYSINNSEESMRMAAKIGKKTGKPVYAVYSRMSSALAFKYGIKTYYEAGPREFLNLLINADLVVSNSFHGNALSIILQTPFLRLAHSENGTVAKDDRLDSLLSLAGLDNRTVTAGDDLELKLSQKIDWNSVKERLAPEIEHGTEYLRNNLN